MMTFTNTTGNLGEIMDAYLDSQSGAAAGSRTAIDTRRLPDWDTPCMDAIARSRRLVRATTPVHTEMLLGFVEDQELQDDLRLS